MLRPPVREANESPVLVLYALRHPWLKGKITIFDLKRKVCTSYSGEVTNIVKNLFL
jgi:hypothetical protein